MSGELTLIVCANLEREVISLSGLPEFRDIRFQTLPVKCDLVEARWDGLDGAVRAGKDAGHPQCLVGSFCLTQAVNGLGPQAACPTAQRSQCFEWIAEKDVLDHFLKEEALLLLPGWLKNWERHVDSLWPSERKKAAAFFRESATKAVLLDTGVYPKVENDLKDFARFLRFPYETYFAGLGHFKLSLIQTFHSWQMEQERDRLESRMMGIRQQTEDYSRIGHLLGAVSQVQTEEEARDGIIEILHSLLAPQNVVYHPLSSLSQPPRAEDSPQDRILSLNADYAWNEDRSSVLLKVANGREILGAIEVSGLAFPERREHDLNVALTIAKMASLAFLAARSRQELKDEKEKARATEIALLANEEKVRSFEGVPVGLYRTTPSGQIMDANPALARILGYPDAASLMNVNAWDLHLNQSDRENWKSMLESTQFVESFETQLRRRDGTVIWVRDTARAIKDRRGKTIFYDGSLEDITRQKHIDSAASWNFQMKLSQADVSGRLLGPTTIEEMSGLVLEHVQRLTASPTAFVGYTDRQTGRLIPAALSADAREMLRANPETNGSAHLSSEIWRWVTANKKPILTNMPTLDPRFAGTPEWHFPVSQFLAAPALMEGALVGLIAAANSERLYSERELEAVEQLATFYAIAVDRKRKEDELREMSLTDELTGLHNRRGFFTLADQQLKIANRSKKEMFLLYADLDGLKFINDTFGHDEGDRALAETAGLLRDAFRESDIIARIGGDEFVVLAVDAGEMEPEALMGRVQEAFASRNAAPGRGFTLSISQGVATYDPGTPCLVQDLINEADKRMYEEKTAKKSGPA
jgi:diguanylate cyclase (GGDEF)-like protein/PAS domain S-box-containing protein